MKYTIKLEDDELENFYFRTNDGLVDLLLASVFGAVAGVITYCAASALTDYLVAAAIAAIAILATAYLTYNWSKNSFAFSGSRTIELPDGTDELELFVHSDSEYADQLFTVFRHPRNEGQRAVQLYFSLDRNKRCTHCRCRIENLSV